MHVGLCNLLAWALVTFKAASPIGVMAVKYGMGSDVDKCFNRLVANVVLTLNMIFQML